MAKLTWISPLFVATALNLHRYTVLKWARNGKFPPYDMEVSPKVLRWHIDTLKTDPRIPQKLVAYLIDYAAQNPAKIIV